MGLSQFLWWTRSKVPTLPRCYKKFNGLWYETLLPKNTAWLTAVATDYESRTGTEIEGHFGEDVGIVGDKLLFQQFLRHLEEWISVYSCPFLPSSRICIYNRKYVYVPWYTLWQRYKYFFRGTREPLVRALPERKVQFLFHFLVLRVKCLWDPFSELSRMLQNVIFVRDKTVHIKQPLFLIISYLTLLQAPLWGKVG